MVEHGCLVEPDNAEALAAAIETLYFDTGLRMRLGAEGLQAVQQFEMQTSGAVILEYSIAPGRVNENQTDHRSVLPPHRSRIHVGGPDRGSIGAAAVCRRSPPRSQLVMQTAFALLGVLLSSFQFLIPFVVTASTARVCVFIGTKSLGLWNDLQALSSVKPGRPLGI